MQRFKSVKMMIQGVNEKIKRRKSNTIGRRKKGFPWEPIGKGDLIIPCLSVKQIARSKQLEYIY